MTTVRKTVGKKVDEVYALLKRRCVMSDLAPGQQLIELELAGSMQCSQSTVREALLRLQEDGLVVRHGYRGTVVTSLSPVEAEVFLDLRSRLEVEAIRQSVSKLRPDDFEALRADIAEMVRAASDDDSYALFEADLEFHMRLFRLANLPALVPILVRCSVYNHRNKIAQSRETHALMETALRHHEIVNALESGDPADVERVMRHHVLRCFGDETGNNVQGARESVAGMSLAMQAVYPRVIEAERALADIATLPPEEARLRFARVSEGWNRFDRERYDIEKLEIPPNPLSRNGAPPLRATRVVRADRKENPAGVILHLHGGGWSLGSDETGIGTMARLANLSGCAVIGLNFRLSIDAPHPAGLNDCVWGWRWLRSNVLRDLPWFVAGDFTGANLALATVLDLRNAGEVMPDGALLFCGVYSEDLSTDSFREFGGGGYGPTVEMMRWHFRSRSPGGRHDPRDPRVAPLHADLTGLPPVLVVAAALDPLRDDSRRLAERLAECGTPFTFKLYDGVVHDFIRMADVLPEAMTALHDAAAFTREIIDGASAGRGAGRPPARDARDGGFFSTELARAGVP